MRAATFFRNLAQVNNEVAAYNRETGRIEAAHRAAMLTDQADLIRAEYDIFPAADHMRFEHKTQIGQWAMIFRATDADEVDRSKTRISRRSQMDPRAFEIVIEERIEANRRERLATMARAA